MCIRDRPLIVKENNVNFAIYLNDGAMVGVFLDQKDVRKSIKNLYSKGKTVLNTFSYTGAFSMAAAKGLSLIHIFQVNYLLKNKIL